MRMFTQKSLLYAMHIDRTRRINGEIKRKRNRERKIAKRNKWKGLMCNRIDKTPLLWQCKTVCSMTQSNSESCEMETLWN